MPVAQISQGDLQSEPYGYPRRGKQGESGAAYQMIQGTLPSDVQMAIYRRKAKILDKIAKAKEAIRIRKLKAYYGDNLPDPGAIDWRNIIPPDNAVFHKQYAQTIQWERTHPKLAGFLNGLFNLPYADPKPKTKYEAEQKAFGEAEGRVFRQKLNLEPED
jgi:hypothetical protein